MAERRPTSYDVAKLAGVSQSAVSRVFSPNGSASKKVREKVHKAAQELGFAPNPIAKSLSLGRSQLAGLVVTQYAQQNYPVALKSAVDFMAETGDSLLIRIVDPSDAGDRAVANLLEKRVDFLLCAASLSVDSATACHAAGVPLVMVNRTLDSPRVDSVSSPNADAMEPIVRRLSETGARQLVFLGGGSNNWVSQERWRGCRQTCRALQLPDPVFLECDARYGVAFSKIHELFRDRDDVDAIVSANDAMALGAMDALRFGLDLAIPDDVQVVGHDDIEAARYRAYRLTSVRQDMNGMFLAAIELAVSRLDDTGRSGTEITVPNQLIQRDTTR